MQLVGVLIWNSDGKSQYCLRSVIQVDRRNTRSDLQKLPPCSILVVSPGQPLFSSFDVPIAFLVRAHRTLGSHFGALLFPTPERRPFASPGEQAFEQSFRLRWLLPLLGRTSRVLDVADQSSLTEIRSSLRYDLSVGFRGYPRLNCVRLRAL